MHFAMYVERAEPIQQLALLRCAYLGVELDDRSSCLRLARLPPYRLDTRLLDDLVNAFQDTWIARRSGHPEG